MKFYDFLEKSGGLHDAVIREVVWRPRKQELELFFDDIYSNFQGLPEYPGKHSDVIIFYGLKEITVDIQSDLSIRVYEVGLIDDSENRAQILFSPGGRIKLEFTDVILPKFTLL